ncbi:MAG TPA: carboxypeptidase-like regulatory domain-containing protein, partial [Thermoanaerobaculia bacterium]|nr:carboxypeptidase-like regulatory domain-containing protein [Thermoanaerobaculia bacterium]
MALSLAAASAAWGDAAPAPVAGIVRHLQVPIPGALVFVYGVSDARLNRARTQPDGSFQVEGVPAGVYDVIAYKTGFYPSLIRLWHQSTPTASSIAIDLVPAKAPLGKSEVDVWSWRDRLPADVLREITSESAAEPYRASAAERIRLARVVNGDFSSRTNVAGTGGGFSRTEANLYGSLPGALQYSFRGSYASLTGDRDASRLAEGTARDGVLLIAASPDSGLALTSAGRDFASADGAPARLQREGVRFDTQSDGWGRMEWSLSRRSDDGFDRATSVAPDRLPAATRDDALRGRWSRETDESRAAVTVQIYRRQISDAADPEDPLHGSLLDAGLSAAAERAVAGPVSLGARVSARAGSAGSFVSPGGTLRLRLADDASLVISAARGVSSSGARPLAASAPRVVSGDEWQTAASSDASAAFSVGTGRDGSLEIRASSSEISEPLRLYFDGDLLLDVGSIYLFDGNRLEKLSGSASARLSDLFD